MTPHVTTVVGWHPVLVFLHASSETLSVSRQSPISCHLHIEHPKKKPKGLTVLLRLSVRGKIYIVQYDADNLAGVETTQELRALSLEQVEYIQLTPNTRIITERLLMKLKAECSVWGPRKSGLDSHAHSDPNDQTEVLCALARHRYLDVVFDSSLLQKDVFKGFYNLLIANWQRLLGVDISAYARRSLSLDKLDLTALPRSNLDDADLEVDPGADPNVDDNALPPMYEKKSPSIEPTPKRTRSVRSSHSITSSPEPPCQRQKIEDWSSTQEFSQEVHPFTNNPNVPHGKSTDIIAEDVFQVQLDAFQAKVDSIRSQLETLQGQLPGIVEARLPKILHSLFPSTTAISVSEAAKPPDLKLTAAEQNIFPYIVMSLQKHPQYREILDHIDRAEELQQESLKMAQKNLEIECGETVDDSCVELQSLKGDLLEELQREGNIIIDDMRNEVSQFRNDNSDALQEAQYDLGLAVSGVDTDLDNMITQKVRLARVRIEDVVADGVRSIQRKVNEAKTELRDVKAQNPAARREPSDIQTQVAAELNSRMQQMLEAEVQFDARIARKLADAGAQIDAMIKQKLADAESLSNGSHYAADVLSGGSKVEKLRSS